MPPAGAALETAIVTTVGIAKLNVKKHPVSSRRFSLLGPLTFTLRFLSWLASHAYSISAAAHEVHAAKSSNNDFAFFCSRVSN